MLPMTVRRRFDCVLAPTKAKVMAECERWGSKLKGKALDSKLNKAAGQPVRRLSVSFAAFYAENTCFLR